MKINRLRETKEIDKGFEVYIENTLFMFIFDKHTRQYHLHLVQHGRDWAFESKTPIAVYTKGKGDTIFDFLKSFEKYVKETKKIEKTAIKKK